VVRRVLDESFHEPSVCLLSGRSQLSLHRCVRIEVLSPLDAEWEEHPHHFKITRMYRLFVQYARKAHIKVFVVLRKPLIKNGGHVHEPLLGRTRCFAERINFDLSDQPVSCIHIRFRVAFED